MDPVAHVVELGTAGLAGIHVGCVGAFRHLRPDDQAAVRIELLSEEAVIDGFKGGLSAENYISIAKTSRATVTRDLQDLVEKGAFTRTGERRHTRYYLKLAGFD